MCENTMVIGSKINIEKVQKGHDKVLELLDVVSKWNAPVETRAISDRDLRAFPLWEWIELNPGVWTRRRNDLFPDKNGEGLLLFDTIMRNASELGDHYHEWLIEDCQVVSGTIYDKQTNTIYREGDSIVYNSHQRHHIIAMPLARLLVTFKRTGHADNK